MPVPAETDGKKIFVQTGYADLARAQEVPGSKWDKDLRVFRYPLSWATCVALRGVFGDDLEIGPNLREYAEGELQRRVGPAMEARQHDQA